MTTTTDKLVQALEQIQSAVNADALSVVTARKALTEYRAQPLQALAEKQEAMNRRAVLALAESHGAKITGKPDGSEAVSVVFTPDAWCAFSDAITQKVDS